MVFLFIASQLMNIKLRFILWVFFIYPSKQQKQRDSRYPSPEMLFALNGFALAKIPT